MTFRSTFNCFIPVKLLYCSLHRYIGLHFKMILHGYLRVYNFTVKNVVNHVTVESSTIFQKYYLITIAKYWCIIS